MYASGKPMIKNY